MPCVSLLSYLAKRMPSLSRLRQTFPTLGLLLVLAATPLDANAKYASLVIDAQTGKILHAVNSDTRNHPASLTKMMTLYKIFEAVDSGRWTMDTRLKMSARATRQPPSKIGLKPGATFKVRDAIPMLIVKSANDIAAAVAENHSGSERAFGRAMTATARQLGMTRTVFRNASGLYHSRQLSTARDMARLARALIRNFPHYYHYFSVKSFTYRGTTYKSHNKLLTSYQGSDGFKTGYIRAAGFNLVSSANRSGKRIIGVVFGGRNSKSRDRHMKKLLDKGFARLNTPRAPAYARREPSKPAYQAAFRPAPGYSGKTPYGIQVGAFKNVGQARAVAVKAQRTVPNLLRDRTVRVVPLQKRNGRVLHRARLYGLSKWEAFRACTLLEQRNIPCLEVKVVEGGRGSSRSSG